MIEEFLDELARFSATPPEAGITRLPFTEEAYGAQRFIAAAMISAGLAVRTDKLGTVYGHLEGEIPESVLTGSHYDSVRCGGRYDGAAGIAVGVAAARHFTENGVRPYYSLDVAALNDEEGLRFTEGFLSSKALCGELEPADLERIRDRETGQALGELAASSLGEKEPLRLRREVKRFIEVHIEQGGILYGQELPIGLVKGIVGMARYQYRLTGQSNHAGTTQMEYRRDALAVAAKIIGEIPEIAGRYPEAVATVGCLDVRPGSINVIPGYAEFSLDVRAADEELLEGLTDEIKAMGSQVAAAGNVRLSICLNSFIPPVKMNRRLFSALEAAVREEGLACAEMSSGAGHDAQIFSRHVETAMLFVPSKDGCSHSPWEYTETRHLEGAKRVLIRYLSRKTE